MPYEGTDADFNDTIPAGAKYCVYRLVVTDEETGRRDHNRNGFKERRVLRVKIEPAVALNLRPVALATANAHNTTGWEAIGIGDTVELNASTSHGDSTDATTTDGIVVYEWYRALFGVPGQRGWKKIGEGEALVDELPVVTRRVAVRYFVKVTNTEDKVDNSINRFKARSLMNFRMDPTNEINRKPIGILGFKVGARLRPVKVIRKGGDSEELTLDASRSRDREGVTLYTFEKSEDGGANWSEACAESATSTCLDTPSNALTPFRRYWSKTLYKVLVKDADANEDYSVNRVAYVRNGIADTRNPVGRVLIDGRGIKVIRKNGETQEVTINVGRSTDDDEIVNYKIEKSNDNKATWEVLSDSPTVTSVTDTPNADNTDASTIWSRTFYKVTVTDPSGNVGVSRLNRRGVAVYVRTVTPDTTKPIGTVIFEGETRVKTINNNGTTEEITLDAGNSSDNSGYIATYTFSKSETGPSGTYTNISGCEEIEETTCKDTPSLTAQAIAGNKSRTWYKVIVKDGEDLLSLTSPIATKKAYVDVVKPVTAPDDTRKPVARLAIPRFENGDVIPLLRIQVANKTRKIKLDASTSTDAVGVTNYKFMVSSNGSNVIANFVEVAGCNGANPICIAPAPSDTNNIPANVNWSFNNYRVIV